MLFKVQSHGIYVKRIMFFSVRNRLKLFTTCCKKMCDQVFDTTRNVQFRVVGKMTAN